MWAETGQDQKKWIHDNHVWVCNKKQLLMEQFELQEIEYVSWRPSLHIVHCGDSPTNTWRVSRKSQPVSCCILSPRHSGSHSDSEPRKRTATTLNFLVPCAARVKQGPQTVDDLFYRIRIYLYVDPTCCGHRDLLLMFIRSRWQVLYGEGVSFDDRIPVEVIILISNIRSSTYLHGSTFNQLFNDVFLILPDLRLT